MKHYHAILSSQSQSRYLGLLAGVILIYCRVSCVDLVYFGALNLRIMVIIFAVFVMHVSIYLALVRICPFCSLWKCNSFSVVAGRQARARKDSQSIAVASLHQTS